MQLKQCSFNKEAVTKRQMASTLGSVFDPIGVFNPILMQSKIFILSLCRAKVDWDQQLDEEFLKSWKSFHCNFEEISSKKFPRRTFNSNSPIKLCVFTDVSKKAFGCAFYVVQDAQRHLFFSKVKASPLKARTLLTLELVAVQPALKCFLTIFNDGLMKDVLLAYATCTSDLAQPPIHPNTHQNIFPKCIVRNSLMLPETYAWQSPPGSSGITHSCSPILVCRRRDRSPHPDSLFAPLHSVFTDHRLTARLGFSFGFRFGLLAMASTDSDVPKSVPSSPAMPSTSAPGSSASSAHRTCLRCARQMSSLKYDKHTICVTCRDTQCSVDVRCSECSSWSVDFMLGYVKHQKSLVSKGKKTPPPSSSSSSSSPSPSRLPAVQTAAPVAPPHFHASTEDQLKHYVHSFLSDFLSQLDQLGTTPLFSAPPAVLNSASLLREVAVGLGAELPTKFPLTESSGKVLPMTQVDIPPPAINVHAVSSLASGVVSSGGGGVPYHWPRPQC